MTLASPVDLYGPAPEVRVAVDGVPYRGSLRVLVNPARNAQRRQPRRPRGLSLRRRAGGDGAEALRRDRGAEGAGRGGANVRLGPPRPVRGRGLRHLPGSQVSGVRRRVGRGSAFDRGGRRHARARPRPGGQFADALFVSTCGGVTENVENVFSGGPVPYLVSVECGELPGEEVSGSPVPRDAVRAADVARMAGLRSAPSRAEESRGAGRESGGRAEARGGAQAGGAAHAADPLRGLSVARQRLRADGSPSDPADGARRGVLRRASLRRARPHRRASGGLRVPAALPLRRATRSRRRTASSRRRSTAGSRSRSRSARSA